MQVILRACLLNSVQYWLGGRQSLSIGSLRWADMVIKDPRLSGVHFRVETRNGHCWLRDLDSRHGTRVNGVRVLYAELRDGDEILAGDTRFIVRLAESVTAEQPVPAPNAPRPATDPTPRALRSEGKPLSWQAAG